VGELADEARAIFAAALKGVDVEEAVRRRISLESVSLRRGNSLRLGESVVAAGEIDRVMVVALGKAGVPMYRAAERALAGVRVEGIVVGVEQPAESLARAGFYVGAHPTPDARSLRAAEAVLDFLRGVDGRTAVLFLVSGGASAMVEKPLDAGISLEDTAAFHRALVGSGLAIAEMNALRKHFSAVKGGRLAEAARAARVQATLLVSDVPAGRVDAIASGLSVPDGSTVDECRGLLRSVAGVPTGVREFFAGGLCVETPKPRDAAFARAAWEVILSSDDLARAAAGAARAAGFYVEIDNGCDEWEYRDAARYLLERSEAMAREHGRSCLISVGEVSVRIEGDAGEGGRNRQLALWAANELAKSGGRATVLSAGSDGIDGIGDAAGAVCDETTVGRARAAGLSVEAALRGFESGPLLRAVGDEILTGATGSNLRDLRLVLRD
jgi:glycerate 2-kinase